MCPTPAMSMLRSKVVQERMVKMCSDLCAKRPVRFLGYTVYFDLAVAGIIKDRCLLLLLLLLLRSL